MIILQLFMMMYTIKIVQNHIKYYFCWCCDYYFLLRKEICFIFLIWHSLDRVRAVDAGIFVLTLIANWICILSATLQLHIPSVPLFSLFLSLRNLIIKFISLPPLLYSTLLYSPEPQFLLILSLSYFVNTFISSYV